MIRQMISRSEYDDASGYLDDPDWLREQYQARSKPVSRIASQLDVRQHRVRDALQQHEIYRLSPDDIRHNYAIDSVSEIDQRAVRQLYRNVETPDPELDDEDDRDRLFGSDELVNLRRFADRVDLDPAVIYEHLRDHGIGLSIQAFKQLSTADETVLGSFHRPVDQDDLRRLHRGAFLDHVSGSVSAQELAAEYGVPEDVVADHCRQHGVVIEEDHLRRGDDPVADVIDQHDIDPSQSVAETDSEDVGNVIDSLWTAGKNLTETMLKTETDTAATANSSTERSQLFGTVRQIYPDDHPIIPEYRDQEIEQLARDSQLILLDVGDEDRLVADQDALHYSPGDEITVEARQLDQAPAEEPDLWLSEQESALARVTGRDRAGVSSLEIRDDQLDETMEIRPHCSRSQWLRILYQRANSRLGALMEGAA